MALKTIVDSLDDVPEGLAEFYKEADDKFILEIEGINEHPTVVNLKNAHERQKANNRKLSDDLTALSARFEGLPEDFDASAYEALKQQAEGKEPPKTDEQVARVRDQLERKHAAEKKQLEEALQAERSINTKLLVDDGLSKAMDEAGIASKHKMKLVPYLKTIAPIKVEDMDGNRAAVVETDMGPMPLAKFVMDWAASDDGREYVTPPSGGGASGNHRMRAGEINPFSKDHWNKTEQGRLKSDPVKAERFARAAGFKSMDDGFKAVRPLGA